MAVKLLIAMVRDVVEDGTVKEVNVGAIVSGAIVSVIVTVALLLADMLPAAPLAHA